MPSRIKIVFQPDGMWGTQVFVDGVEVHGVRDITIRNPVGDVPTVTLELIGAVEIEGEIVGDVIETTAHADAVAGLRTYRARGA